MASKISHYGLVIKKRLEGVKIVKSQYYELKKHIPIISLYVIDISFNLTLMLFKKMLLSKVGTGTAKYLSCLHIKI